ncbi:hypothetical protein KH5_17240 [Urechidicola sp. KH5]
MKQKITLFVLLISSCITLTYSQSEPNVIIIIADDMGWNQVSSNITTNVDSNNYGSTFFETPRIDQLAAEGIAFPNGYVNGANCAPTRAALLSGQYAARPHNNVFTVYYLNRGNDTSNSELVGPVMGLASNNEIDEIPSSAITIAESMQAAGYTTAHFGKYHMGEHEEVNFSNNSPLKQGFDYNYGGGTHGGPGDYLASEVAAGVWEFSDNVGPILDAYADPYTEAESILLSIDHSNPDYTLTGKPKHVSDAMTDAAIDFIGSNVHKPFFMHFSNYAIHGPFKNPEDARFDLRKKYEDKKANLATPDPMDHDKREYQAAIAEGMDQAIGRLVDFLSATDDPRNPGQKLSENTIIYFISDNGDAEKRNPQFPLKGMKGEYYEGGIRSVTFAWSDPTNGLLRNAGGAGEIDYTPLQAFDLYPTFVEAAGGSLPSNYDIDGVSQWQMLTQGTAMTRETLFWHHPGYLIDSKREQRPVSVVRKIIGDNHYKLIYNYESEFDNGIDPYELYHLFDSSSNTAIDIGEDTNLLSGTPSASILAIASEMSKDLITHLTDTNAPLPRRREDGQPSSLPFVIDASDGSGAANSMEGCQAVHGYLAYWDFDSNNNTDDAFINEFNAIAINGSFASDTDRKEGDRSASFNNLKIRYSDKDEVAIDGNGTLMFNSFTERSIAAWIKPSSLIGLQTIFEEGSLVKGLALRLNGNQIEATATTDAGGEINASISGAFPNDGEWHHVALVFNGSTELAIYIDASKIASADLNTNLLTKIPQHGNAGGLGGVFGSDAFGANSSIGEHNYFTGLMDAFAIYDRALTLDEIEQMNCFESVLTNTTDNCSSFTGFEANWNFNGNANDSSSNNNNALNGSGDALTYDSTDYKDGSSSLVLDGTRGVRYATGGDGDAFMNEVLNARTVTAWIKPNALNSIQNIYEEGDQNSGIAIRLSGQMLESIVEDGSKSNSLHVPFPVDGDWHHVALVYDGSVPSQTLYIDGAEMRILSGSWLMSATVASNENNGGIGAKFGNDAFNNGGTAFFDGKMDAVAVYDTALSQADIQSAVSAWYLDADGDNFAVEKVFSCSSPGPGYTQTVLPLSDCDDSQATNNPGVNWYPDTDLDGYGDRFSIPVSCAQPAGYVSNNNDCNDSVNGINPGATEIQGNAIDEDCDGIAQSVLNIDLENLTDLNLYPNPFKDDLILTFPTAYLNSKFNISIVNMNGGKVLNKNVQLESNQLILSKEIQELTQGLYILQLTSVQDKKTISRKIVKL